MKQFQIGMVIGKFYPPHLGHHYLIDIASQNCNKVYVLVCWKSEQAIPIEIRYAALTERHPEVEVLKIKDELDDNDTAGWAAYTLKILGQAPDAVFSSEDYGEPYAKMMGSNHVMVDRNRTTIPCSGTMIRQNPLHHLDWISQSMRAYYVKRICLVGAESTGKTTLAKNLAEFFKTLWVPEYGREYCIEKWKDEIISEDWTTAEFVHIAIEQSRREDEAARTANKVLICDTDAFATSIWHERYLHHQSSEVKDISNERKIDLYILTGDEIPFIQDGFRDGEKIRSWMQSRFIEQLNSTHRNWICVSGTVEERMAVAIQHIEKIML